jgi:hypothetical protein
MATEKTTFQVAFVGEFRVNQTNNLPKPLNRHTVNFFWAIPVAFVVAIEEVIAVARR